MADRVPKPTQVREQLARMLRRATFTGAPTLGPLLEYLTACTLSEAVPEEWQIAVDFLGRPADWNAVEGDAAVRVGLHRLRNALRKYYEREGGGDPVIITVAGRRVLSEFNPRSPFLPPEPTASLGDPLGPAAREFFMMADDSGLRCVVTGETEDVDWHRLDSDPFNDNPANLIPLCARLRSHIDSLKQHKIRTGLVDLDPRRLAEELAPRYFQEWRIASAYGCASLAFYLGEPPYGVESDDMRLLRLCDVIYYVRHRFFEPVMAHLIRATLLPFLNRIDSIGPLAASRLALQLTALLDESGYRAEAEAPLAFAERLNGKYAGLAYPPGSLNAFTLLRRRAQLAAELAPNERRFESLLQPAQERVEKDVNRELILKNVTAYRWLRQSSDLASKLAYENLFPIVSQYSASLWNGRQLVKPPGIDVANLAEIFLAAGISACRVQPGGWERYAEEMLARGKRLLYESRYILATEYRDFISPEKYKYGPKAIELLKLSPEQVKPMLRDAARIDIASVLKCLARLQVLGNRK
jgi:hypothetical protein